MNQVAGTIWAQLGSHRFAAMTGANRLADLGKGLMFRIPCRVANVVVIQLNARDYYDVTFYKEMRGDCVTVKAFEDVAWDQLQPLFTEVTGLRTNL